MKTTTLFFAGLALLGCGQAFAANDAVVTQVQNDEKETLVADTLQRTLYVFDVDQGSGTSKCVADCAEVWPPYLVKKGDETALQAPLGFITRANGQLQLTYDSRPVYTYAFDRKAGDDQGDGLGGVWHYIEIK